MTFGLTTATEKNKNKKKNQQAEALLTAGQRRLKAEGAGRARSALTSQRKALALQPVASPGHLSPTLYSLSCEA